MRSPTRRASSAYGWSAGIARIARSICAAVRPSTRSLRRPATLVSDDLVGARVEGHEDLLQGPLAKHDDQAGEPVADRDEVHAADVRGRGLGGRREAGGAGQRRDRRGREAEPVLAGVLHLPELVPDHQLLDLRHQARSR